VRDKDSLSDLFPVTALLNLTIMVVKTPIALKYLYTRRHQITDQMSRLIDVSNNSRWDVRAKKELEAMQAAYKATMYEINLLENLNYEVENEDI
jgi:hypothetical protein|tara:strand:- start:275 stop:556 length:282 start_codon:yes stop_codon:yes gene_type:complete